MSKLTFIYDGQINTVEGKDGETLLKIGLDNDIPIENACGGNGFCTTCMCKVKDGVKNLSKKTDREESMGMDKDEDRLTCQAKLEGDVTIELYEF